MLIALVRLRDWSRYEAIRSIGANISADFRS